MIDQNQTLVSVIMITFKHESYLLEAINGVLDQRCDFSLELIIADDCSPDRTQNIVESFESHKNFKRIKYTRHINNKGMTANFIWALQEVTSKYIALCEGDDFWTDSLKLQKQVDFLESNPEYSYCFHDSMILNQITGTSQVRVGQRKIDEIVGLKSLILENNISTASIVFRNCLDWSNLPDWFLKTPKGDYALVLLLSEKGLGKFLPFQMSTYRVHEGGVWSGKAGGDYYSKMNIDFFYSLLHHFPHGKLESAIKFRIKKEKKKLSLNRIRNGELFLGAKEYLLNDGFRLKYMNRRELRLVLGAIKVGIFKRHIR